MNHAYNNTWLHNLQLVKEVQRWQKPALITAEQLTAIRAAYPCGFYHPNFMIRLLLFLASLIGLGGVTGLLVLMLEPNSESTVAILCTVYGVVSFAVLDRMLINGGKHYKSGVTEALLYHAAGYTMGGLMTFVDFNEHLSLIFFLAISAAVAYRYLDLVATVCAIGALAFLVFYEMYEAGGMLQHVIPIAMMLLFAPLYFLFTHVRAQSTAYPWRHVLVLAEALCLLLVYAAGNYLVVRELSVNMMNLDLVDGSDIPLAWLFYLLTVAIPFAYLYFGIRNKNMVLLRVSLVALAFSVFTFKYYFSLGHHEITFTVSGALLLGVAVALLRYLKTPRHGYTRENILSEKWADMHVEALLVSQTMGGNKPALDGPDRGGGGAFGGGGSTNGY